MSLTSHLADKESPIRQFMCDQFPDTKGVAREFRDQMRDITTIRPTERVPYSTIGTALDYRLRYYFAMTPVRDLLAYHGAHAGRVSPNGIIYDNACWISDEFFANLEETLQECSPVGQRLDNIHEATLARHCFVLALFEEVYRRGIRAESPLFAANTVQGLLDIAADISVDDLCSLSWTFYDGFNNLLARPATLNPTFEGSNDVGGADADLIVDNCLIDIKATVDPKFNRDWLYQLLGYTLLDYSDHHKINSLALYMARQGIMLQWSTDQLLTVLMAGRKLPIEHLRAQFRDVVSKAAGRHKVPTSS